jgi:GDP-L-fucose synthase
MAEVQAQTYAQEFGMEIAIVRPYNTYGPRDHFDPQKAHVIPAIIRRVVDEEDPSIVWGDGEQSRAFVYVSDVGRGMLLAAEKYPNADPLNIGSDEEVKTRDLVSLIVELSGKRPKIVFDASKPTGQPRRSADTTKARSLIGYEPQVSLEEGLRRTIEWYVQARKSQR